MIWIMDHSMSTGNLALNYFRIHLMSRSVPNQTEMLGLQLVHKWNENDNVDVIKFSCYLISNDCE
jgi:hypothetical protein